MRDSKAGKWTYMAQRVFRSTCERVQPTTAFAHKEAVADLALEKLRGGQGRVGQTSLCRRLGAGARPQTDQYAKHLSLQMQECNAGNIGDQMP